MVSVVRVKGELDCENVYDQECRNISTFLIILLIKIINMSGKYPL
jgi:hypothetical protein